MLEGECSGRMYKKDNKFSHICMIAAVKWDPSLKCVKEVNIYEYAI